MKIIFLKWDTIIKEFINLMTLGMLLNLKESSMIVEVLKKLFLSITKKHFVQQLVSHRVLIQLEFIFLEFWEFHALHRTNYVCVKYVGQKKCKNVSLLILHVCMNEDTYLISGTECEEFWEFPLQMIKDKQNNISIVFK